MGYEKKKTPMAEDNKISVVINTYNAEKHLERVLDSVSGFDEVVVCDMESTDNTVSIALGKGCRVVNFPKGEHKICEPARNFAIHSAHHEWVLVVDADELVTTELRQYLYGRISRDGCPEGLFVPRRNPFMGRYLRSSPDYQLRFLRRDKAFWPPVIHCIPDVDGTVEKIPNNIEGVHLLHLDDASIGEMVAKLNRYTDYEVAKRINKGYGLGTMFMRPVWFFLRSLLLQGGIAEGRRGVIRAYMKGIYQMVLLSKITEYEYKNDKKQ